MIDRLFSYYRKRRERRGWVKVLLHVYPTKEKWNAAMERHVEVGKLMEAAGYTEGYETGFQDGAAEMQKFMERIESEGE